MTVHLYIPTITNDREYKAPKVAIRVAIADKDDYNCRYSSSSVMAQVLLCNECRIPPTILELYPTVRSE